jgi:hypothetical protein
LHRRARQGETHAAKRDEQDARHVDDFDNNPRGIGIIALGVDRKGCKNDARDIEKRHGITPQHQRKQDEKNERREEPKGQKVRQAVLAHMSWRWDGKAQNLIS